MLHVLHIAQVSFLLEIYGELEEPDGLSGFVQVRLGLMDGGKTRLLIVYESYGADFPCDPLKQKDSKTPMHVHRCIRDFLLQPFQAPPSTRNP